MKKKFKPNPKIRKNLRAQFAFIKHFKILPLFFLATSCMTVNQIQTARTLPPKHNSCSFGIGKYKSKYFRKENKTPYSFPIGGIYYRRGVLNNLDVGLKIINLFTFGTDIKYQLLYGAIEIAAGLSLGYGSISQINITDDYKSKFYDLSTPIYFTLNFNDYISTTITPTLLFRRISEIEPPSQRHLIYSGGSYGLKAGKRFGLIWTIGYYRSIFHENNLEMDKKPLQEMNFAFFWNWSDSDSKNSNEKISDLEKIESFSPEEYEFLKDK